MRWLILNTIRLNLALMIIIGLALTVGHAQPPAAAVTQLHLTDCAPPCWLGIVPRQTSQGEVEALFTKAYPQHEPFLLVPSDSGGGVQMQTYSTIDPRPKSTDLVPHIFIADMDPSGNSIAPNSPFMPHLGDILLLWGPPTCISVEAPDFVRLHYNIGRDGLSVIDILVKGHQLWAAQPVFSLSLFRTPSDYGTDCFRQDRKPWSGFVHLP